MREVVCYFLSLSRIRGISSYNDIRITALNSNVSRQETCVRKYFIIISMWIDFRIRSVSFSLLLVMEVHFVTVLRVLREMRLIECRIRGVIIASREQLFSELTVKSYTWKTKQTLTRIPPHQHLTRTIYNFRYLKSTDKPHTSLKYTLHISSQLYLRGISFFSDHRTDHSELI